MNDIELKQACDACGQSLTLMESVRGDGSGQLWLVKRCLNCGGHPVAEVARLHQLQSLVDSSLPPIGEGPRKPIKIEISVPVDWEQRLDMQSVVEREVHADRWQWSDAEVKS